MAEDDPTTEKTFPPVPIVNGAHDVPSVFADSALFCTVVNGVVRITFAEHVVDAADDPNPGWKTRKVGNLVLPLDGFVGMVEYFNRQIEYFKAQGWLPDVSSREG